MKTYAVKEPCSKLWRDMSGDDRARFCADCQLTVHNFASLTRRQAEKLVRNSDTRFCGRLVFDDQGNPVFRPDAPNRLERLVQISLLGMAGLSGAAAAQQTCTLNLRVTDSSGAFVPGAQVTISQNEKAIVTGSTNPEGRFNNQLAPGQYSVSVISPGFAPYIKSEADLTCPTGEAVNLDATLQVGLIGEVIEVRQIPELPIARQSKNIFRRLFHRTKKD